MNTVEKSREEALLEARERVESVSKKKREDKKVKHGHATRHSTDGLAEESQVANGEGKDTEQPDNVGEIEVKEEDPSEPPSEQELELLEKLAKLKKELADAQTESKSMAVNLARARISTISPFAANPFLCGEDAAAQDQSLMTAAMKKEKSKMGNTGNKRKVVTPATMLDRCDTFFTQDVERFIEGLTNSELAPLYVFHANRTAGISSQAWAYEAKIRHQNAMQKKLEKEQRAAEEAEAKALVETEKLMQRMAKEEEVASKRRLKEEEEDQVRLLMMFVAFLMWNRTLKALVSFYHRQ
jgi:hypothetical protein